MIFIITIIRHYFLIFFIFTCVVTHIIIQIIKLVVFYERVAKGGGVGKALRIKTKKTQQNNKTIHTLSNKQKTKKMCKTRMRLKQFEKHHINVEEPINPLKNTCPRMHDPFSERNHIIHSKQIINSNT